MSPFQGYMFFIMMIIIVNSTLLGYLTKIFNGDDCSRKTVFVLAVIR